MLDTDSPHSWELPAQAREVIAKLRQRIIEEPARFDMHTFGVQFNPEEPDLRDKLLAWVPSHIVEDILKAGAPACGTVACNAGNILIVTGKIEAKPTKAGDVYDFDELVNGEVDNMATEALFGDNPTYEQRKACSRLFYFSSMIPDAPSSEVWPPDLEKRYKEAKTATERVNVNLERLDRWEAIGI